MVGELEGRVELLVVTAPFTLGAWPEMRLGFGGGNGGDALNELRSSFNCAIDMIGPPSSGSED
jgi:hypothetical protein